MKKRLTIATFVAALLLSLTAMPLHAARRGKGKVIKMTGTFVRGARGGQRHPLKAVFTRKTTRTKKWEAVFNFNWGNQPHTYKGAATMSRGKLAGTVKTEDGGRTFGFTASRGSGKYVGTHHEISGRRNRKSPTGDFDLKEDE